MPATEVALPVCAVENPWELALRLLEVCTIARPQAAEGCLRTMTGWNSDFRCNFTQQPRFDTYHGPNLCPEGKGCNRGCEPGLCCIPSGSVDKVGRHQEIFRNVAADIARNIRTLFAANERSTRCSDVRQATTTTCRSQRSERARREDETSARRACEDACKEPTRKCQQVVACKCLPRSASWSWKCHCVKLFLTVGCGTVNDSTASMTQHPQLLHIHGTGVIIITPSAGETLSSSG